MNYKSFVVLVLFFLWSGGSTYWYVCKIKGFCENVKQAENNLPDKKEEVHSTPPDIITYKINNFQPEVNDSTQLKNFILELKNHLTGGKKLLVIGPYSAQETLSVQHPGLKRAENLKQYLTRWIPDSLIKTDEVRVEVFDSTLIGFKNRLKTIQDNEFVQENNGKVLIYFPFNSDKQITTPEILEYLNELANELKKNPSMKIIITGHTDNIGDAQVNKKMGFFRAERIKKILLSHGVNESQIQTKSMGEEQPIADNKTPEGRKKNRRVEITIVNP